MQQTSLKDIMEIFIPCSGESFTTITSCFLLLVLNGPYQAIRDAPWNKWDSTSSFSSGVKTANIMCNCKSLVGQDPSSWCERSPPSSLHYNGSFDWSASLALVVCAPLLQLECSGSQKRSSWSLTLFRAVQGDLLAQLFHSVAQLVDNCTLPAGQKTKRRSDRPRALPAASDLQRCVLLLKLHVGLGV